MKRSQKFISSLVIILTLFFVNFAHSEQEEIYLQSISDQIQVITKDLKTKTVGKRVYYFEEIDSTQNFAQQIALDEKENGTIVIAEKQTAGKGRLDRKWTSPKGGIWFSLIVHPKFDVSTSTLVPIAGAVALAKAIKTTLDYGYLLFLFF